MTDNDTPQNESEDKPGKKRQNPWGSNQNNDGYRGGGASENDNNMDEVIRRAQEGFSNMMPGGIGGGLAALIIIGGLALLWLVTGLYTIQPGEQGAIKRFGEWTRTETLEGLHYHLPFPIETVEKVNVNEIRLMTIGFRASSGRQGQTVDLPDESLMLTSDRNIVDMHIVIQWNIKSTEQFLFEIYDQENTIKKVAESAIREVVGQNDMFQIITTGRTLIADQAKKIIQENLDAYNSGVNITQVLIERAEVHPEVQNAFQDVQSAKQDAADVQNRARAYREDILPKARGQAKQILQQAAGYKESTVAKATGDADRFNSIYEAYQSGKDVTKERIYIETMENILQNANKIILDSGKNGTQGVVPYLPLNELGKKDKNEQK